MSKEVPLWYKAASAVIVASLAACQLGEKFGYVTPPPEGTSTNPTEVVPPPSSTVEATAPASIQPMVQETPVAGATSTPEAVSPAVWAPPTLEQMVVEGRGGALDPEIAKYKFEEVIPNGLARVGIENTAVNFSDNGLSGNDYRWAPLTVNPEGLVIWAYDPTMGQLEWSVKLDPLLDAAGNTYYRLHTEGLLYQAVPDSEGAQIVWGGTKDGISGKYLAVLAKDPLTLPDGRQIYSVYWDRTSQSWLPTPGLAELMLPPLPEELSQIPKDSYTYDANGLHITVAEGRIIDIPQNQIAEKFQGKVFILDLNQQSESGYQLGVVFRDGQWRETLLDVPFQTDGTKLNELPEVVYEDIASGRLAEAERLVAAPFPEGVKPLNNYYYDSNFNSVYPNFDPQTGYEFSLHPEKFPMRFVYFYQAEINNIPVVMATLQVLNQDYSSIFIHYVESRKFINSYPDYWNKVIRLQRRPTFDMALGGDKYDICGKGGWSKAVTEVTCPLNAPKRDKLQTAMQELVEEQSIPEELEKVLFVLSSGKW